MLDELKRLLPGYEISAVTKENFARIYDVYDTNQEFFMLTQGERVTMESGMRDIEAMPPGFDAARKIYIGIWENGKAIGVLDLLEGYPEKSCVWIGLLMIHGGLHGRKIGSGVTAAVLAAAKAAGYKSVQLGVMDNNAAGMAFWRKHGFEELRIKDNIIVMENIFPP